MTSQPPIEDEELKNIIASFEKWCTKSGFINERLLSRDKVLAALHSREQRLVLEARIDELEKLSWNKNHPPEFSGHDSGSISLEDRIAELEAQLRGVGDE